MTDNRGRLGTQTRDLGPSAAARMAAALALLALVGLASTAPVAGGDVLEHSVIALIALTFVAIAGIAITVLVNARRRTKLIIGSIAALLVSALLAVVLTPREQGPTHFVTTIKGSAGDASGSKPPAGRDAAGDNEWLGAVAVGGSLLVAVVILAAATVFAMRRRRRFRASLPSGNKQVIVHALDESLDDLRRERDVRRAIIACYARMERAFERVGNVRRPAETPLEYLVRILEQVTASGRAARVLTELFERAKFSVEAMGEREKQLAIGALELLRDDVREAR